MSGVRGSLHWNFDSRLRGYARGDRMELCYEAEREDLSDLPFEEAAQLIFQELNHDRSPNSHHFPSLSIGDVVSYRKGEMTGSLGVKFMGFKEVPTMLASDKEIEVCREKQDQLIGEPRHPRRSG